MTNLHDLPIGSGYHARGGRASLSVVRTTGDSLALTSGCDSMQVLLEELTIEQTRLSDRNARLMEHLQQQSHQQKLPQTLPWRPPYSLVGLLMLLSLLVGFYLRGRLSG